MWDGLALRGDVAIVIECKGTFIDPDDKYSGEPAAFFDGLTKKFGRAEHAGVHQLSRGISEVWFEGAIRGPIARPEAIKEVFPILVVQDPIFRSGPVTRVLSDEWFASIETLHHQRGRTPRIWPLTVMTADDVDRLSTAIQMSGARLDWFLKAFHRAHPSRMTTLGEFFGSSAPAYFGPQGKVRAAIRARFEATGEATLQRFRNSEYRGSPGRLGASSTGE